MANGYFLQQYQPLDYRATIAGAGAPAAGLMGGVQKGMELGEKMRQLQAEEQAAQAEQQRQALAMQAAQGDLGAQQELLARDPEAAYNMQRVQLAQEKAAADKAAADEAEAIRIVSQAGNIVTTAKGLSQKRDGALRLYDRIKLDGDDPAQFGMPDRTTVQNMSVEQLDNLGQQWQSMGMSPEELMKLQQPKEPLVKVELPAAEQAYAKEFGKGQAQRVNNIITSGDEAQEALDTADQILAFEGISTGQLEPLKANIAATLESIGVPKSVTKNIADVTSAQALESVTNRGVNAVLNMAKGPQTEGDAKRARSTIANLGDDPRAFTFKANTLKAAALRKIEMAQFYSEKADQGLSPSAINKQWREFTKTTPNLSSVVTGPDGLPVYYFQFQQLARERQPDIGDDEIIAAWRGVH